MKPNQLVAKHIIKKMKEFEVLIKTDGPDHNVIKLKPPIIFNKYNANFLLNKLSKTIL
tara:strand:- start:530 stop:703 length:174 start_codon:yes stop_codon:yes gene_type:complete